MTQKFCFVADVTFNFPNNTSVLWFKVNIRGNENVATFNPNQYGEEKSPPTSISPGTSTNVGIRSQKFLTFSFSSLATLVQNVNFVPSASPKLSNLNQDHPSKKEFFWSNLYKIEVIIIFLIEMLQLPKFGHIATSIIKVESLDHILLVMSWSKIMMSSPLLRNTLI